MPGPIKRVTSAPVEFDLLLSARQALVFRAALTAVDAGLTNPSSEAADGEPKALGNTIAGEPSCRESSKASAFCCAVKRRVLVGVVIDGQPDGPEVTLVDLSSKPGEAHGDTQPMMAPIPFVS